MCDCDNTVLSVQDFRDRRDAANKAWEDRQRQLAHANRAAALRPVVLDSIRMVVGATSVPTIREAFVDGRCAA